MNGTMAPTRIYLQFLPETPFILLTCLDAEARVASLGCRSPALCSGAAMTGAGLGMVDFGAAEDGYAHLARPVSTDSRYFLAGLSVN